VEQSPPERPVTPLLLTTRRTFGGGVRLAVSGEIDLATVGPFRDRMLAILREDRVEELLVDAEGVQFIDASALAALAAALRLADHRGVRLAVVNCRPAVLRALEITGADKALVVRAAGPGA
jgi:anti-sigma B factor antagonist